MTWQLQLSRPDGRVLAWVIVPDGAVMTYWRPLPDGGFIVGDMIGPQVMRPPWRCEVRPLPDGEWITLAEQS